MKINGMDSSVAQFPLMTSNIDTTTNLNFQMILGATLTSNVPITPRNNSNQEIGSIMNLIQVLIENIDTDEENVTQDLSERIEANFPNWTETFKTLIELIKENSDSEPIEESIKLDNLENEDFLTASVYLFQMLSEVDDSNLNKLPVEQMAPYIKAVKQYVFVSQNSSLSEMKQIEELEVSLQHLLTRLQEISKGNKLQTIRNSLELAFFKNEQNTLQGLGNIPVLQKVTTKLPHDQAQNMIVSDSEDVSLSTPNMFTRTESFILKVGETVNQETAMRGLIKEFSNILARSSFSQGVNTTKLLIRLYPEELGTLRIELLQKDGLLTARIIASTNKAKEMLDFQLQSLRQAFTQQNIAVERIEVTYSQGDLQRYTNQDSRGSQQHQSEQNQKQEQSRTDSNDNFKDALSNVLFETEV